MAAPLRILVIDDNPQDRLLVRRELLHALPEFQIREIRDRAEFEKAVAEGFDAVVTDYQLGWSNGLELLRELKAKHPLKPVVMHTGSGTQEIAVAAMKEGLDDYITKKPQNYVLIPSAVQRALKHTRETLERQRAEQALVRVNRELQQFAYIAAHDLQEPLRNVGIFTELLRKRYLGRLDGDADEILSIVIESAQRMHTLVRDLRAYTEVLQPVDDATLVDANQILREELGQLDSDIGQTGAQITFQPLPKAVCIRREHLSLLFSNLIENSLKYRNPDAPPRVRLSADRTGDFWLFAISDNGIGIDPEYGERIFGVFKRLHGAGYPGTGIGLAICSRIVEQYGGRIWVESEKNQGATFKFTLAAEPENHPVQ